MFTLFILNCIAINICVDIYSHIVVINHFISFQLKHENCVSEGVSNIVWYIFLIIFRLNVTTVLSMSVIIMFL